MKSHVPSTAGRHPIARQRFHKTSERGLAVRARNTDENQVFGRMSVENVRHAGLGRVHGRNLNAGASPAGRLLSHHSATPYSLLAQNQYLKISFLSRKNTKPFSTFENLPSDPLHAPCLLRDTDGRRQRADSSPGYVGLFRLRCVTPAFLPNQKPLFDRHSNIFLAKT